MTVTCRCGRGLVAPVEPETSGLFQANRCNDGRMRVGGYKSVGVCNHGISVQRPARPLLIYTAVGPHGTVSGCYVRSCIGDTPAEIGRVILRRYPLTTGGDETVNGASGREEEDRLRQG